MIRVISWLDGRWPRRPVGRALFGAACLLIGGLVVVGLVRLDVQTTLASFLPEEDRHLASYEALGTAFGAEPLVVLVETDSPDEPVLSTDRVAHILRLEGELAQLPGIKSVYGPATTLNQMAGRAKDLLLELLGRRDGQVSLAREQARAAGASGAAIEAAGAEARTRFDARYGPLIVNGMQGGLPTLSNQEFIDRAVYDSSGLPHARWRSIAPRRTAIAIYVRPTATPGDVDAGALVNRIREVVAERAPEGTTTTVTGTAVIVSAMSDRAVRDAPLLGLLAMVGLGLCLVTAVWIQRRRRWLPLALTAASLIVSLSVIGWIGRPLTLGMVAFCPVLLGLGAYYPTYVLTGASRRTVAVVGAASAASLATLWFTPLPLVGDIGLLLGLGVTVCLLLSLALGRFLPNQTGGGTASGGLSASPVDRRPTRARFGLTAAALLAAWGWWLLPGIPVSTEVAYFAGGLPELEDANHAEDLLGGASEIDIVLTGRDTLTPAALAWMRDTEKQLGREHGDVLRSVLGPPGLFDFLGDAPSREQIDAAARLLPSYLTEAVVTPDRSQALLAYSLRLDDVAQFGDVRGEIAAGLPRPPAGYEVELVGLPMVLLAGQDRVSDDRHEASLFGIGVAALVLLLGLRRRGDALRAIGGALVATGLGFLLLSLTGRGFDPVTVALGTLTVAVGAEFTVVRAEAHRRGSPILARTVGLVAMTSIVGYLALLGSGLAVVRGFGLDLAATVLLAYAASHLVVAATVSQGGNPDDGEGEARLPASSEPVELEVSRG